MDFHDVIGHVDVVKHLQNAVNRDLVSHAYLFHGEGGSGKRFTADIFSMALLCEAGASKPCGTCRPCRLSASGNHPDIIRITHDKTIISVEDIRRQLNHDIFIKPCLGNHKIYIIDEAELMNEQAQNALLKTMEEPPLYAVVLLLSSSLEVFLPTILSRCILIGFRPLSKAVIKKNLMEQHQVPDYLAEISAAFSGGIYGRAVQYACSDVFSSQKESITHILSRIHMMSHQELLDAVQYFSGLKKEIEDCIGLLLMWIRDILVYKACEEENLLYFRNEAGVIREQAGIFSFEGLNRILNGFDKLKRRLSANVNFEVSFELLLLEINGCRNEKKGAGSFSVV